MRNYKENLSLIKWLVILALVVYIFIGCASNQELKEYRIETKHDGYIVVEMGYTDGFKKYPNYHERIETDGISNE